MAVSQSHPAPLPPALTTSPGSALGARGLGNCSFPTQAAAGRKQWTLCTWQVQFYLWLLRLQTTFRLTIPHGQRMESEWLWHVTAATCQALLCQTQVSSPVLGL